MRTKEATVEIATYMGMTEEEVMRQALAVFLQERKKSIIARLKQ